MKSENERPAEETTDEREQETIDRRNFLRSLGKWSLAVIGCVAVGSIAESSTAQTAWVNRRGGGYGGGGAWANRAGGGGAWANGGGGYGGGSWVNGRGGGGGAWVNRRGY